MKWTNTENKIRHILECVINFRTVDIEYDIYCRNVFDTNTHTHNQIHPLEKKKSSYKKMSVFKDHTIWTCKQIGTQIGYLLISKNRVKLKKITLSAVTNN